MAACGFANAKPQAAAFWRGDFANVLSFFGGDGLADLA
jgi:hypothetical protein